MLRDTSLEAIEHLRFTGALGPMKMRVYTALWDFLNKYDFFPTGGELSFFMGNITQGSNSNVITRLGELREKGMVKEHTKRDCKRTGYSAHTWEPLPQDTPLKFDKPQRHKCKACNGKGFIEETQSKFF
jgi:hypothetical protein